METGQITKVDNIRLYKIFEKKKKKKLHTDFMLIKKDIQERIHFIVNHTVLLILNIFFCSLFINIRHHVYQPSENLQNWK